MAKRILLAGLVIIMLAGCATGGGPASRAGAPVPDDNTSKIAAPGGTFPAFPVDWHAQPPAVRHASDAVLTRNGTEWTSQAGTGNRDAGTDTPANPLAYVLIPGGDDDLAWAQFTLDGITSGVPVEMSFNVLAAPLLPGGDEDLPLKYWLGFSDYTMFRWEWRGPFTTPGTNTQVLNFDNPGGSAGDILNRYLSSVGTAYAVVAVEPGDAARLENMTCQVSSTYTPTKPHYAELGTAGTAGGKGGSRLHDSQKVHLGWTHVASPDIDDKLNEAAQYKIFRTELGQGTPLQLGTMDGPGEAYIDPDDNDDQVPPLPEPIPGRTYAYQIQAVNLAGSTPLSQPIPPGIVTIPMVPPDLVRADLTAAGDAAVIRWSASEGALSYKVLRRYPPTAPPVEIAAGITQTVYNDDTMSTLPRGDWVAYSVIAVGRDDTSGRSSEAPVFLFKPPVSIALTGGVQIEFQEVPGGTVQLGSPAAEWGRPTTPMDTESPYQPVSVPRFYISRTEITNAQWLQFMQAEGYNTQQYWNEGWAWREASGIIEPYYWNSGMYNSGASPSAVNYPVLGVSWYEANAFCNWLSKQSDVMSLGSAQLATEAQWEYAAEGPRAQDQIWLYPWWEADTLLNGTFNDGDDDRDMQLANSALDLLPDNWTLAPSPAGSFSLGRSWCGALDMAGNVQEWTGEMWLDNYALPYIPFFLPGNSAPMTVRGGGFTQEPDALRCSARGMLLPEDRDFDGDAMGLNAFPPTGVRVVIIPPIP